MKCIVKPVNEMGAVSEVLRLSHWPLVKRQPTLAMANEPIHNQNLPFYAAAAGAAAVELIICVVSLY